MPTKKESSGKAGTAGAIRERLVLDLGELSERELASALQAFERLAPGDSLELAAIGSRDRFSSNYGITTAVTFIGGRSSAARSYGG